MRTAARVSDGLALDDERLAPAPQRVRGRQPEQSCADDHHVRALDLRHAPTLRRRRENQLMRLELVTLVVRDYDEALAYYTGVLGFVLVEDTRLTETKRWIVVRPPGSSIGLLLARSGQRPTAGPHRGSNRWTRRLLPVHRRPRSRPRTPARGRRALPWRTARRAIRHGRRVRGLLRKCLGSDRTPFAGA